MERMYFAGDVITFSSKDAHSIYKAWKACADYAEILHNLKPEFPYLASFYSGIPCGSFYKIVAMWYFGELLIAFQHNSIREANVARDKYNRIVKNIYYERSPMRYIKNGLLLTQGAL